MRLVDKLHSLDGMAAGCVATIGNFDGVHVGHHSVIERLASEGRRLGLPVAVVLFEPQPREFFAPLQAPPRLTRLREKLMEFARLPVDVVLLLRFDRMFANLPPEAFVESILVDRLNVKFLAVGDDFRFGKDRAGDFATLSAAGRTHGFRVTDTDSVLVGGERVSSTLIREVLAAGDLDAAVRFLGRPYSICGRIVSGDRRGRDLGFPTANIALARKNSPIRGVFVVTMHGYGEKPLPGVANIGLRPTIDGSGLVFLETHLLDFEQDLYGRRVEVRFHRKLRDEQRFSGLAELQTQIRCDVDAARAYLREARIGV